MEPDRASTFASLLAMRARQHPEDRCFTFLLDGGPEEVTLTYGELDRRARAVAAALMERGQVGDRVLLLFPPGLDYVVALFGCFHAGRVAVPAYPPEPARLNRTLPRLQAIIQDSQALDVLTTEVIHGLGEALFAQAPELARLRWVATDALSADAGARWQPLELGADAVALLQYTSGSTSSPRGVLLTHGNLLHNSGFIRHAAGLSQRSRAVFWLPLFHDMGLIGGVLQPIFSGFPCTLMSSMDFLARPIRWLQSITRYGATLSGGPNFAYDLCVRRIPPQEREQLDLSSWEVAFNGAEPVRAETLERFAEAFAPCGFRREALFPCYGLAEATLAASLSVKAAPPVLRRFRRHALEAHRLEEAAGGEDTVTLVGCGRAAPDQRLLIVNPETRQECPPDQIGEIWLQGPSVGQSYFNHSEETEHTFAGHLTDSREGPFLRTGDLGALQEGELFVTGRLKDIIILSGRNYYPQDMELAAESSHPALRRGCGAAFSIPVDEQEALVVVQEVEPARMGDPGEVLLAIRQGVARSGGPQLHAVVLIAPRTLPKTSSGKVQRQLCRRLFMEQRLEVLASWQLEHLGPDMGTWA